MKLKEKIWLTFCHPVHCLLQISVLWNAPNGEKEKTHEELMKRDSICRKIDQLFNVMMQRIFISNMIIFV